MEGIVSKRVDGPYAPGNRGLWLKVECLHREEFVVIGWTDPEGGRPLLGALPLGRLQPLATATMPGAAAARHPFRLPLVLSRVHWARPELVVEVKFLVWAEDNLLRQVVYECLREDEPAREVRREVLHA